MRKIHLIMPMAGAGSRFAKNGYTVPKPLIPLNGKPFFYWATRSITDFVEVEDITFVVLQDHITRFKIDEQVKKYFSHAKIIVLNEVLNGALLTSMEGVKNINDDLPIIFNDCDHAFLSQAFNEFCDRQEFAQIDGGLLTFTANDAKYSYLKLDENQNVIQTVEKQVISNHAICGAYYFKNKNVFTDSSKIYLDNCQYSEYFMSGVYNVMAAKHLQIKNFHCDIHCSFGTPEEFSQVKKVYFLKDEK